MILIRDGILGLGNGNDVYLGNQPPWSEAETAAASHSQLEPAAALRPMRSSCSALLSAPIVNASSTPSDSANLSASSCRFRKSPSPKIFIPINPLPAAFISRNTLVTVVGSASMCEPIGLIRAKSTSTHCDLAAAHSASMLWQEQPCARIVPFSFAADRTSITPLYRAVQSPSVRQCIKQTSR